MANPVGIIPLGGVGEVGALNLMVYQYEGKAMLVDAGSMFPEQDMCGVDLAIPDIRYLKENDIKVLGLVATHGHEDHIGAIPFIVADLPLKIYAADFARGLIRSKLAEYKVSHQVKLVDYKPGERIKLGPFTIDTVYMNHSFPDVAALIIHTPQGNIMHLTDWKIDREPTEGRMSDLEGLQRFCGVDVLLADSTNAAYEGWTRSERAVVRGLEEQILQAKGRVIITLFSSNVNRLQNIFHLAQRLQRKVALVGRSMNENTELATKVGILKIPPGTLISRSQLDDYRSEQVIVLASGTQGEARSALTRMAMDDHPEVDVRPGDTVLMSSKQIPGNEKAIGAVINHLYRRGAVVYEEHQVPIHASGHAMRDEMREIFRLVQPKNFIPIHGDYSQLKIHAQLAIECGVPEANVFVIEDGQAMALMDRVLRLGGTVPTGRVFVDGGSVGHVDDVILRDRQHLSQAGMVVCVIMVDKVRGQIVRGPELTSKGFIDPENPLMEGAKHEVLKALENLNLESMTDWMEVQEQMRLAVRRFFRKNLDRKPIVIPVVLEV